MSIWKTFAPTAYSNFVDPISSFKVGDAVRITDPMDMNYGMIGTILRIDTSDNSHLIEFETDGVFGGSKHSDWYYGTTDFILDSKRPNYSRGLVVEPTKAYCAHNWKEDKWFTSKIFKTCTKCGKKFEDV